MISTINRMFIEYEHRSFVKLISELQPKRIMEIGLGEGFGTERMIKVLEDKDIKFYGFDIIEHSLECSRRILKKYKVKKVNLFLGDTKIILPKIIHKLPMMDFIYIDGGHDYETVKSDWENSRLLMDKNTVVVFDDFAGSHLNVEKAVNEINGYSKYTMNSTRFFLTKLPVRTKKVVITKFK